MSGSDRIKVRVDIESTLGWPLSDERWQWLVGQGYVGDIESGARTAAETVVFLRNHLRDLALVFEQDRARPDERDRPKEDAAVARIDALSVIYAAWAGRDSDVRRFRRLYLVDLDQYSAALVTATPLPVPRLLNEAEVLSWITARYREEEVMAPEVALRVLWYIADRQEHRVSVPQRGELGELARLAEALSDKYQWRPSEATSFVLTGSTPEVHVYKGSATVRHGDLAATTRVTMTLDPFLTPRQVADIYARLRERMIAKVPKSQGLRRYLLAQHVGPHVEIGFQRIADRTGPGRRPQATMSGVAYLLWPAEGYTWRSLLDSWNEKFANDSDEHGGSLTYTAASNFTTHAKQAVFHLLFPGWDYRR